MEGATTITTVTHLAAIARLASPGIRLQFVLDHLREVLGSSLETRQLDLGRTGEAVLRSLGQLSRPLGKAP